MSDLIKLLPDHVANQIAAGEVIQRPSSVVKELLENSIDAGATNIKLIIRDGGKTVIQIIDNGKGMSPTDARMCWERHATSKINKVEDIFQIKTMGFRGEALASIASVAMVELKTKRAEDQVGTLIKIQGSEVKSQEATATADGTSITVKNLFYNIPARRNFLKSDAVETRHIMDEFVRIALAHPEIGMSMHQNDNESYLLKSGNLALRIKELFKYEEGKNILPISEYTTIANVIGYVGKPELAKKTRGEQFFFVNNRFIKDPYLNHAIVSCYEQLIQKDQFPFYVLNIEIDPAQIDVNVHPTKTEIKFEDERSIYQIIKATGKKAIGQHFHVSTFEPSGEDMYSNLRSDSSTPTKVNSANLNSPPRTDYKNSAFSKQADSKDWQELFQVMNTPQTIGDIRKEDYLQSKNTNQMDLGSEVVKRNLMQVHNQFIVAQVKTGLLLINQQAAHERILFEQFLKASSNAPVSTQQKLFPVSVQVSASDETLLYDLIPDFKTFGIDINAFGKQTFVISGMPAEMGHYNEQEMVLSLLEQYKQQAYASFNPHERIARILATKLAVSKGVSLSSEEMASLVDELFACSEPNFTPTGVRCIKAITLDEMMQIMEK